jgi:hypothetical protein
MRDLPVELIESNFKVNELCNKESFSVTYSFVYTWKFSTSKYAKNYLVKDNNKF